MSVITLSYAPHSLRGAFVRGTGVRANVWSRLASSAREIDGRCEATSERIELPWVSALSLLRRFSELQDQLDFEFDWDESSEQRIQEFLDDYAAVRRIGAAPAVPLAESAIADRLAALGWNVETHALKPYQLTNLARLLSLRHGANFSVPGAGKTTVTLALHLLAEPACDRIIVAAPKNAFAAWEGVIDECLSREAPALAREPFIVLTGGVDRIGQALDGRGRRFLISYDQLVRVDGRVEAYLASNAVHFVLDESHRMKAGYASQRGTSLLRMGHLATRRDILTGTPMPQSATDLKSQLDYLWPSTGLGERIAAGESPRSVMGALYVRTTKGELGLPPRVRRFEQVSLSPAHLALYSVLQDDLRARASELRQGNAAFALTRARRSVIRLLQCAVNPALVVPSFESFISTSDSGLLQAALEEGVSARVRHAVELTERLVADGRKVLLWTIFTNTIHQLQNLLSHCNPALIYGDIDTGDADDDATRQGQLRRFKQDPSCSVLIANPAAAAEGISLHLECHDAIYVDRSYNAAHFLQSIDRIHRLGLPPDTETTIYVLQNRLPLGVASIDASVQRRLGRKIRDMERLLADPDLHELALEEENASMAIEDTISLQDIDDLISELEGTAPQVSEDDLV